MTYPTPPGPRIAYDLDGTICFYSGLSGSLVGVGQAVPAFLRALNSDSPRMAQMGVFSIAPNASNYNPVIDFPVTHFIALRFPEPKRIRAIAMAALWGTYGPPLGGSYTMQCYVETSNDSTNGMDGTWETMFVHTANDLLPVTTEGEANALDETYGYVNQAGSTGTSQSRYPNVNSNYRRESEGPGEAGWREVTGGATRQVTWLRITPYAITPTGTTNWSGPLTLGVGYKLHLYGEPDTAASDDRLIFTDVAEVEKLSFDWGDVGVTSEHFQTFKVKNISSSQAATGITLGILSPNPDTTTDAQNWLDLSLDGSLWVSSMTLPDLAPGEASDTITLRVQVGVTVIGPSGPRLSAEVEEWV